MNYEFNATLFDMPYRRDRAIAESWLYADGLNDEQEVQRTLATVAPETLASEVWEAWGFENADDEDAPTLESLVEAFRDLAAEFGGVRPNPRFFRPGKLSRLRGLGALNLCSFKPDLIVMDVRNFPILACYRESFGEKSMKNPLTEFSGVWAYTPNFAAVLIRPAEMENPA